MCKVFGSQREICDYGKHFIEASGFFYMQNTGFFPLGIIFHHSATIIISHPLVTFILIARFNTPSQSCRQRLLKNPDEPTYFITSKTSQPGEAAVFVCECLGLDRQKE